MPSSCTILSMLNWFSIFEAKYVSIANSSAASNPKVVHVSAPVHTYRMSSVRGFSFSYSPNLNSRGDTDGDKTGNKE